MRLRVKLFGTLRPAGTASEVDIELPEGARVRDLLGHPGLAVPKTVVVSVNHRIAAREAMLADGDRVSLLQPVYGG